MTSAQSAPTATDERLPIDLFHESERSYRDGRYADAVDLLLEAYRREPQPVLLYNLALAYENLGKLEEAVSAYQRYAAAPEAVGDRGTVQRRVALLQKQLAEREQLRREQLATEAALEDRQAAERTHRMADQRRRALTLPAITAGMGVLVLLGGAAAGVVSHARNDAADAQRIQSVAETDLREARGYSTAANIGFAAGGALVSAGVVWAIVRLLSLDPDGVPAPRSLGTGTSGARDALVLRLALP